MLSKVFSRMFSTAPNVWVNKHTKVICQGITGNQVHLLPRRAPSKLNRPSITERKWSEESIPRRQEPLIWVYPSSRTVCKPKRALAAMLQLSMSLLLEQLMLSSKPSRPSSTSLSLSLTVPTHSRRNSPTRYDQGQARPPCPKKDQSNRSQLSRYHQAQ